MRISTLMASAVVFSAAFAGAANATVTLEFNPSWGSTENTGAGGDRGVLVQRRGL